MRILKILPLAIACVATGTAPLWANAQQTQTTVKDTPPVLEKLEEGEPPAINIKKPGSERKITEERKPGQPAEIKVQTGNSTYYLKENKPAGSAMPGDAQSDSTHAAQWKVLEFGGPKKAVGEVPPSPVLPEPPTNTVSPTEKK